MQGLEAVPKARHGPVEPSANWCPHILLTAVDCIDTIMGRLCTNEALDIEMVVRS